MIVFFHPASHFKVWPWLSVCSVLLFTTGRAFAFTAPQSLMPGFGWLDTASLLSPGYIVRVPAIELEVSVNESVIATGL